MKETIPFFTPIYDITLDDINNDFVEKQLHNFLNAGAVRRIKNNTSYQTKNYTSPGNLNFLFDSIQPFVNMVTEKWGISRKLNLVNWWYTFHKKYDYGEEHYHPEGIISGCYYVKVPKDSGNIVFERPDLQVHYFEGSVINEYNYKYFSYFPSPKLLILFPSYLKHKIEQNLTTEEDDARISVAFNYG
jgi:uncharacterized protein (TIGR02466 family)